MKRIKLLVGWDYHWSGYLALEDHKRGQLIGRYHFSAFRCSV